MAICYPNIETAKMNKVVPQDGELYLLNFLSENLDNSWEIFFQPFLNGDRPDVIIMKKDYGLLIIEVKDWNLDHYRVSGRDMWALRVDNTRVLSPFRQVNQYKKNIINLHLDSFIEKGMVQPDFFSFINCAVYFHKETLSSLQSKAREVIVKEAEISKSDIWSNESLNSSNFQTIIKKSGLNLQNPFFSEAIYNSIKRYLLPPFHTYQEGKEIIYSPEQKELTESKPGAQKIKGVVGCGKTLVLAKRAVNAFKRTGSPVLILTFNISLRNYIHDRISDVREDFDWSKFHIIHYHQFVYMESNNIGVAYEKGWEEAIIKRTEVKRYRLKKYKTILIDEGQDFQYEWLQILKDIYLDNDGEFVLFADEKQNIYERELDEDRKSKTNIPGRWNRSLNKSYRLSKDISFLAEKFQKHFWIDKYEIDTIKEAQTDVFGSNRIEYFFLDNLAVNDIFNIINSRAKDYNIHPDDIAVLAPEVEVLRDLDAKIKYEKKEKTKTTFEEKESFDLLFDRFGKSKQLYEELNDIRRNRKFNFWMNPGTMKLSTIHSFKGWEINSLFLIIYQSKNTKNLDELIYTGFTRCRNNLFIINVENKEYHKFFEAHI